MATLYLLGTGAALSDAHRTTTMLAVEDRGSTLVLDCGGDVVQRMLAAGLDLSTLAGLILTHEHADHVGGFPLFMEKIWLSGRRDPIPVYGIAPALDQARRCFATFDTSGWDGLPEIIWREIPLSEGAPVIDDDAWRVTATPVVHSVPNVGFRIACHATGGAVTYSSDTEPSPALTCLAYRSDILVHEATGAGPGHSSAEQAADVARRAEVDTALLVHLPPGLTDAALAAARATFAELHLGEEGGTYAF